MKPGGKDQAGKAEALGICVLALLAAWFIRASWRKWPDPLIDSGPQWYAIWRVSLGAVPYHDINWYYGPLSLLYNGLLFKIFGPAVMVLAVSNLIIYSGIAALAYLAFRRAWGPLGAFTALAVFISVFSFSMLNAIGNYNYALPYSNEMTHGILLTFLSAFVMARWSAAPSWTGAFFLGLCGGLAAVLKPEIMLACGAIGLAAVVLRHAQRRPARLVEYGLILAGVVLPTLLISLWFARGEAWPDALLDACHGWRVIFLTHYSTTGMDESNYMGFNLLGRNSGFELEFTLVALLVVGAIWAAGWFVNRPWPPLARWALAAAALFLVSRVSVGGGFEIGPCLPGLIAIILVIVTIRIVREVRHAGTVGRDQIMALALVLLAAAFLTRMLFRARINHFGFVQAALAGMVAAAFLVREVPRWTGVGTWGRGVTLAGLMVMLALDCGSVVAETARFHAMQTQPVAAGANRFYAFNLSVDETGAVVDWCVEQMHSAPPQATLLVLPEGVMINFLSRHARPLPDFAGDEAEYIKQLDRVRPDYVIIIWGDRRENGIARFSDPGQPGEKIRAWLESNYAKEAAQHIKNEWAFIFHRKPVQ